MPWKSGLFKPLNINKMYYVFDRNNNYKTYTKAQAIEYLDIWAMIGDLGGSSRGGDWYNDGEGCGIERQDGRRLREIELAPNVLPRRRPQG